MKRLRIKIGDRWYTVAVVDASASPVKVIVDGETLYVEVEGLPKRAQETASVAQTPSQTALAVPAEGEKVILSPMPGKVLSVRVKPGSAVAAGGELCVVEAMKMEQSIRAQTQGVVKAVFVHPGQQVKAKDKLVEME